MLETQMHPPLATGDGHGNPPRPRRRLWSRRPPAMLTEQTNGYQRRLAKELKQPAKTRRANPASPGYALPMRTDNM